MDRYVLSTRRAVCAAAACALAVLALASPSQAQAVRGTLLGNIADTQRRAVPGATVTITEAGHQHRRRRASPNENGAYTFPNLKDGIYRVEAELAGSRRSCARTSRSTSTPPSASIFARSRAI